MPRHVTAWQPLPDSADPLRAAVDGCEVDPSAARAGGRSWQAPPLREKPLREALREEEEAAMDASDSGENTSILERVLLIEDDEVLRSALRNHARIFWSSCALAEAPSLQEARELLAFAPTLVLLDVVLPDGRGNGLLPELMRLEPRPAIVAMSGIATAKEAFDLARLGADAFVAKPIEFDELEDVIASLAETSSTRFEFTRELVGVLSIHEVQNDVRRTMLDHALRLTGWNRTAAARMLNVTRQAVQHMIRDLNIIEPNKGT